MDVVNAYLETMFSPYPQTPRLLEAKGELRGMMEDAYNASISSGRSHNEAVGQVITDFGNLDELAPVLGITAEIHPSTPPQQPAPPYRASDNPWSGMPQPDPLESAYPHEHHPTVTLEEAVALSQARYRTRSLLANAVALFVISPAFLVALTIFGENPSFVINEEVGAFVGTVILLVIVAVGVGMVMRRSRELAPFSRLSEGRFEANSAVTNWTEEQRMQHEPARQRALQISIALWILSAIPTLAAALLSESVPTWGKQLPGIGVPLTLLMVAIGLALFLPTTWAASVHDLLRDPEQAARDEMSGDDASLPRSVRALLAILWPLAVISFLLWSFLGDAWHISWIIWPVAGVLTWLLHAIGSALGPSRD